MLGRLWVSSPGTVSPLHYDETDSYLCQVVGRKRLLLWPASSLEDLQPYPRDHPLARRLRVDVTADESPREHLETLSDEERERLCAPFAVTLEPGDVLYFPANWAHHTEALLPLPGETVEPSFSLGFRTDGQFLL